METDYRANRSGLIVHQHDFSRSKPNIAIKREDAPLENMPKSDKAYFAETRLLQDILGADVSSLG